MIYIMHNVLLLKVMAVLIAVVFSTHRRVMILQNTIGW